MPLPRRRRYGELVKPEVQLGSFRANSRPPSAWPWFAATTGLPASSSRFIRACTDCERSTNCSRVFSCLKMLMVCAGDEGRPGADEDDGVGIRVLAATLDGLADRFKNAGAEGLHRRVL